MRKIQIKNVIKILVPSILATFIVVGIVRAATTIGTNISTGGTLSVTGASTLTGIVTAGANITVPAAYGLDTAVAGTLNIGTTTASAITIGSSGINSTFPGSLRASSTLQVTGASTLYGALMANGNNTFGDAAVDVNLFTGTLQASTTALFTSGLTSYGNLTVTNNGLTTLVNASSTLLSVSGTGYIGGDNGLVLADGSITDTSGAISFGDETLTSSGNINFNTASSTGLTKVQSLKVSSGGSAVAGMLFGTCSVNPQSITVGTSTLVSTSCAAVGVQSDDTVFVTPPSDIISNDNWLVFEGASASSTAGFIEITLFNASTTAAIDGSARTWKWMAIR